MYMEKSNLIQEYIDRLERMSTCVESYLVVSQCDALSES